MSSGAVSGGAAPLGPAREASPGDARSGLLAAILGTIAWGFTGLFVRETHLSAVPVTFIRLWMGVALLGVLLVIRRRPFGLASLRASLLGGLFLALDIALFFGSLKLTSVAVATVIGALQPALVLLVAGRIFGERVGVRLAAWTVLSIAGVIAVAVGSGVPHGDQLIGDALAAGSLLAFTAYWLAAKQAIGADVDPGRYTFGVMFVAAALMTPVAVLSSATLMPTHASDWLWLLLLTLVPGTGHLLFNYAHRHVEVSVSSIVTAGNPLVASVLALVVLGERLNAIQVGGGIVAVLSIAAAVRGKADRRSIPIPSGTRTDIDRRCAP